jgi:outer membrane lipopolysaccharide assembly protein LptE/RlpB
MPLRRIIFLCLLGLLLLNGCGFALRGTTADTLPPLPFKCLTVAPLVGNSGYFYRRLQQALTRQGVYIDAPNAPLTLRLLNQQFNQMATSLGNSGQTTTYLLSFTVTFDLVNAHSVTVLPRQSIRTTRNFSISTTQLVGDLNTQMMLRQAMEEEAAQQMITRLRAPWVQQRLQSIQDKA